MPEYRVGQSDGPQLLLLNGWKLTVAGEAVLVPMNAQRLVALLALTGPQTRSFVAGTLWPEQSERRAGGSLRSTLWRLDEACRDMLQTTGHTLALREEVDVDVSRFVDQARRVIAGDLTVRSEDGFQLTDTGDLLPGWYDEWVLLERERLRQLRIHALEALSGGHLTQARFAESLEAALAAVKAEPLRESANRAVMRVHIAEGNAVDAVRYFERYRELLLDELGLEPSEQMVSLVRPYVRRFGGRGIPQPLPMSRRAWLGDAIRPDYRPAPGSAGREVE